MSLTSTEDRQQIKTLHGHIGPPKNNRDASQVHGQASLRFKQPPTRIETPSNASRTPGGAGNPWGRHRMNDDINRPKAGNQAAQRTVTGYKQSNDGQPPLKKAKHDGQPARRKKVSQPSVSGGKSRPGKQGLGHPDNTDIIIIDGDNEDLGERLVEPDPLNLASQSISSTNFYRPVDGSHTAQLRQAHARYELPPPQSDDSADPIESYSETGNWAREKLGTVRQKVQDFENKNQPRPLNMESHPRLDLSQMKSVKERMKPKNPSAAVVTERPAGPKNPRGKASADVMLPVKAWSLGRKSFDEPYHVVWTNAGKLTIRSGEDPKAPARHAEEIDMGMVAKRIWFVEPEEDYKDKVFVLETFPVDKKKSASRKPLGSQYSSYFKQGSERGEGDIMIKFDSASPSWIPEFYELLINWVKSNIAEREKLRGKAGDAKWEAASRLAQLIDTRVRRETGEIIASEVVPHPPRAKTPAIAGFPLLNDYSPPASILAIGNTAKMRPKNQGGPNAPIEIGSPTRPLPRPLNKPPDSATAGGGNEPVRRSARQSVAPQRPYVDPDEVILVYPPGQTGAVNITNGDVARLAPGEFLNDTLIEFGLKLWLQQLEKENPELVKQIHVFSSFFYKKLNKKNAREGYESVKKWTAKFDLFNKKYIVVPINENLHWYLAIIYHPEHTLKPPPPTKTPSTRRKTRQGVEQSPEVDQASPSAPDTSARPPNSKGSSVTRRSPTPVDAEAASGSGTLSPNSDMQAEVEVANGLVSACSIADDDDATMADKPEATETDGGDSLFDGSMDEPMDVDAEPPESVQEPQPALADLEEPLNDGGSHTASEEPEVEIVEIEKPEAPAVMDVDAQDPNESADPLDLFADEKPSPPAPAALKPLQLYGKSAKSRGKRKMPSSSPTIDTFPPQQPTEEAFPDAYEDEVEDVATDGQPSTYVFTLDSLGTRHPKVVNVLGQYLQFEALEKKGIPMDKSSRPVGKTALVPHQPNFCDCGLYLLHLAQTFISDPSRYYTLILSKRGTPTTSLNRQVDWNDDQTKVLRQKLTERISELSREWKKTRAAQIKKAEEETVADSSDDEVDIVETTPAPPPKTPKVATGKAMRLR
ncbi:hypothetical protein B0H16DRAFT_295419 [Mycena metata]|uniref:Ubiquitin-like protease family profile domain-containing protein n=1 Tax=Mycena metata TaxID=1033252 RepID=A0AAD7P1C0_9AGAR|nr:hypothetical protein B0H16DRAFT_295419 [Mycena metata]